MLTHVRVQEARAQAARGSGEAEGGAQGQDAAYEQGQGEEGGGSGGAVYDSGGGEEGENADGNGEGYQ